MYPSLIQIGSKTAEKTLHKQTDRQTVKQTDTTKIMVTWPWTKKQVRKQITKETSEEKRTNREANNVNKLTKYTAPKSTNESRAYYALKPTRGAKQLHFSSCTLQPRYNVVIEHCRPYRIITRTALYWNEQQKMLVSQRHHIIDPLILYEWLQVVHGMLCVLSVMISDFSCSTVYYTEPRPGSV